MHDSSDARSAILGSIRRALGASITSEQIAAEYADLPRDYKRTSSLDTGALLGLFEHRLREYDANVYRTSGESIALTITQVLEGRKKRTLAIPGGIPASWLPDGFDFQEANLFDAERLDKKVQGILSGCAVAIAETGSIVLQNAPSQGPRILSLVPDYHLCVVFGSQIVETVPQAFDFLRGTDSLPTTFISGPSATADIEMTRIKGVHGPRFFDVVLVI